MIEHLSLISQATAKSYISGISYKIKINNLEDRIQFYFKKKF
jgi:hypothetical protein